MTKIHAKDAKMNDKQEYIIPAPASSYDIIIKYRRIVLSIIQSMFSLVLSGAKMTRMDAKDAKMNDDHKSPIQTHGRLMTSSSDHMKN